MSDALPQAIEETLKAREKYAEVHSYERVRQTTVFLYRDGEDEIELGLFEGTVPVPVVGQKVTVWDVRAPLVVTDVLTHYGHGGPDSQHVSVVVYVDAPTGGR